MEDLRISLLQFDIQWENKKQNLDLIDEWLHENQFQTDLIVLPEMFNTGFSMNAEALAEKMEGPTMKWMAKRAASTSAVVTGTLIISENKKFYNRLIWMRPDGTYQQYDKRHLFSLAGEEKIYTAGKERLVAELNGWKICPQTCYDLRFPVWNRNNLDYDVLLFVANWPEKRIYAWNHLLIARAIENQAYVAGVNRVGNDGIDIYYSGDSAVIDPTGEVLFHVTHEEVFHHITLTHETLTDIRSKLSFLPDADTFHIENASDPK